MRPRTPIAETARAAVALAVRIAGGPSKLGQEVGVSSQAVSQWDQVPASRVLLVERLTGVSRTMLRPDLYPPVVPPSVDASEARL